MDNRLFFPATKRNSAFIGDVLSKIIKEDGSLYLANVSNMPWARPDVSSLPAKLVFAEENKYPVRGNF